MKRLHASMFGDNNPAKRPEVGRKISAAISGDNHPAKRNPEPYREHANRIRPAKHSRLEDKAAVLLGLDGYKRQYPVRWYRLDFADPERLIAVEIMGCWHHACPVCHPEGPQHETQRQSVANDARKRSYLRSRGWTVIDVWEHEIKEYSNVYDLEAVCV